MSKRILVATRKGVFTIDHGLHGWTISNASFLGDNCSIVMHDPRDGSYYAALGHGHFGVKLHRSDDAGANWQPIATPAYPPQPEGYQPKVQPTMGKPVPWTLELVWALQPGGASQSGLIWCGTLPGGLFRSDDRGQTWELNRPLWDDPRREEWFGGGAEQPGIHSICVDPRNADHVTIGVSCGGVWDTTDCGRTWTLIGAGMRAEYMPPERANDPVIQDPHILVRCPTQPDAFWVQHHNGIFRSTDGAKNFTEIKDVKPSVFGFAVAVHPNDPNTAWFVPAVKDEKRYPAGGHVVVNRTRDGGQTFHALTKGLPQLHAYDLVFRHCLDIDASGNRLTFGSTTGSLWITEDQGESWQTISTHLPPIYCVRFVN